MIGSAGAFCLLLALSAAAQSPTGWTLAWSDEFAQPDGSSPDPAKWTFDTGAGGWGNNELEYYTSRTNNARIENGHLVIEAREESYQGSDYTSARLKTLGKAAWTYGRVEARIRIPRGQGIWPAFWMLGTNFPSVGWPDCGEIDIMENIGREPALIHGTLHGPDYSGGGSLGRACSLPGVAAFADDFHVYAVEWTTNRIKWFVDGLEYFSAAPQSLPAGANWVFTEPQFLLLNVAVGGNWPGYPDGTTTFPQRMTVDYVRVYAPASLPPCGTNALANPGFEAGFANWTPFGNGGNTLIERISNLPVHDGTNVFKVYGQFSGGINDSGVRQDAAAAPGQSFTARGWALTPDGDQIAGENSAWLEVSFRDASANTLALYRSDLVQSNTPAGLWLALPVTNRLNPATLAVIGSATSLVAPASTSSVRCRAVFRQPAYAAGAVLFDDLKLAPSATPEFPVPVSIARAGSDLNLAFPTYLHLLYEVRWKTDLSEDWLVLTNLAGDGGDMTLTEGIQPDARFYRVVRRCE